MVIFEIISFLRGFLRIIWHDQKVKYLPPIFANIVTSEKTQSRFLVYRSFLPLGPNTPKTSFDLATPLMFLRTCFCFKLMFKFRKTISFESISSIFHWRVKNKRENKIRWSLFGFFFKANIEYIFSTISLFCLFSLSIFLSSLSSRLCFPKWLRPV